MVMGYGQAHESAEALVRAMFRSWETLDPDTILAFFTDDVVFENVPSGTTRGKDEFRALLAGVSKMTSNHAYEVRHMATAGDLVFAERIDRYQIGEHAIAVPVLGAFQIREGRISEWRDYFDKEMAGVHLFPSRLHATPA